MRRPVLGGTVQTEEGKIAQGVLHVPKCRGSQEDGMEGGQRMSGR